jgi:peptidyl-prolyl cis-trans isomerase C
MLRRLAAIGIAALAVTACQGGSGSKKSGPVVAKGDGFTITADEFKARLEEQSPFMRARYNTLERKKEFLDNLVRFEVLAREAERKKLQDDPEVKDTLRKIMVQKLVQRRFNDPAAASAVPDADVQKFYDEHSAEFHRPKRVRAALIVLQAPAGSPDRAKKLSAAKKALALLQAPPADPKAAAVKKPGQPAEKESIKPGDPQAFAKLVAELSDDVASKSAGGDIGLKTAEEIEKAYSRELADAVVGLKQGEISGVIEGPQALYIAKATLVQDEVNRTLEQVKPQIVARLSREKKAKEFDEWMKTLKDSAGVKVDEKALDAIEVPPAAMSPSMSMPGQPGMHPMPQGVTTPAMSSPAQKPGGDAKPAGSTPAPASRE